MKMIYASPSDLHKGVCSHFYMDARLKCEIAKVTKTKSNSHSCHSCVAKK